MNYKKFLTEAAAAGIEPCEINYVASESFKMSVFHHEIENCRVSNQSNLRARGVYNGRLGSAATERLDAAGGAFLIEQIKKGGSLSEKAEVPHIFEGSEKYTRKKVYNPKVAATPTEVKKQMMFDLENAAYAADPRVAEAQVEYYEGEDTRVMLNSYGLNLKSKTNCFELYVYVVCREGEQTKTGYEFHLGTDLSEVDVKKLAEKAVSKTVAQFNGVDIPSGSYKCVLSPGVTSDFMSAVVNSAFSAENVQKQTSLLGGKMGEKVFSSKVTIEEKPLTPNCFFRYFDDEGVATRNKVLVSKGVVKTWLYNLETAEKDGVESTGNGYGENKIGLDTCSLFLKPGRLTEEQLFEKVKNGVYITSVSGLHSGMNPQSGDFSLEANGFVIRDGKKAEPLVMFTCAGNLYTLFNEVVNVANNTVTTGSGVTCSSMQVKRVKISCV